MTEHTDENRHSFESHVSSLAEVTECFSVSGDRDYELQVVVKDMEALERLSLPDLGAHRGVA